MKPNKWTLGLMALGAVSLASVAKAEEKMSFVQTAVSGTTISGYVDTSVEWAIDPSHSAFFVYGLGGPGGLANFGGSSGSPLGIPFRSGKQDGFNLNVVELNISKPLDETPWASGYNVSLLFGPDAVGYNPSANSFGEGSGADFAIKNANVVLRAPIGNGLDIKIGVFDTIIGYEVFEAGNNPNFSRSWGYAIEPTEHTGILFTYHINDNIAISAGVANTLSAGINTGDRFGKDSWDKTGLASITLTAPQSWGWAAGSTFSAGVVYGMDENVDENRVNVYAGVTVPTPVKGLSFGGAFDYTEFCRDYTHFIGSIPFVGVDGTESAEAYSVALYGSYQATEKLSLHVRGEYVHGDYRDSGTEFDSLEDTTPYDNHYEVDVWSLTGTLQYDLWANVISRLEVRYDEACYKGGGSDHQLALYLNVIYKF